MITPDQLSEIQTRVDELGADEFTLAVLRGDYSDLHFTWCMDDDVADAVRPALEGEGFNIYLVDGREHCLCMTADPEVATGLVIAEVIEDDA